MSTASIPLPAPADSSGVHDATGLGVSRGDFWFRLFSHATLAMAGVCLVHGEAYYLPLLPVCLLPYLVFLVAAFRAEGRWSGLSDRLANVAGVLVVAVMAVWIWLQPGGPAVLRGTEPWVRLVPYIGPFLMALVSIYLFRPKDPNHFWYIQGMGLVQVALGCVLATSPLFGLLMAVYLTCALGCLALHYLAVPGKASPTTATSWRWLAGFMLRFSLTVAAAALAAFLFTPRSGGPVWDPLQRFSSRTPSPSRWLPPEGRFRGSNLNGTTPVLLRHDEAFTVRATDLRGPKLDLSRETRFRCLVLENYQDGIWPSDVLSAPYRAMPKANPRDKDRLPDFGSDQYFLNFDVKPDAAGGLVLAEPVVYGPKSDRHLPVTLTDFAKPHARLFFTDDHSNTLLPVPNLVWSEYRYRQVMAPTVDADRTPADLPGASGTAYIQDLTRQALPGLETWTAALLRRLAAEPRYKLPAEALAPDRRWPNRSYHIEPVYYERVARALCNFLTTSGEYTYSVDQRRQKLNLDPVEDFLFNVKEGHCERYATALALMLRTQGIPSRMIKGYRGVESLGNGAYVVRQNMAHAWVEVLVRHPTGTSGPEYDWLTLDPTPGLETARHPSPVTEWWKEKTGAGADMWQRLIVGYDAKHQAEVLNRFTPNSFLWEVAIILPLYVLAPLTAVTVVSLGLVRLRRRRRVATSAGASGMACYERLLRLLDRRGHLTKAAWQTPRELGVAAGRTLAQNPLTEALAGLPDQVVELFYRVRFGGESADQSEVARLNARLDELANALARSGPLVSVAGG